MKFIKRHRRALLLILSVCILAGAGTLYYLRTSQSEFARGFRTSVKELLYRSDYPARPDLTKGLTIGSETVYVDGAVGAMPDSVAGHDVKAVYGTPDGQLFCDYATGFAVSLPADMTADLSLSPKLVSLESPDAKLIISREWSWGEDVSGYIRHYYYRFLLDGKYRSENGIELLEDTKSDSLERLTVRMNGLSGRPDTYTYLIFKTASREFYRVMLKYSSENSDAATLADRVAGSFQHFRPEGTAVYTTDYGPELPGDWTAETRALYDRLAGSDRLLWGIFTPDVAGTGIAQKIPEMESTLGSRFDIILTYTGLDGGFPSEFMARCYEEGRIVELTLQATVSDNLDLTGHSPWLDLYKTGDDARLRTFARAAREFGRPFLFRLNNEMNSDWVSYGGVINLLDPDIYIENWRTVYRIFEEEGVHNAIWIFNPNDGDYPPNSWNSKFAYYPGNGYAQLYGVTGYNTGTYYQAVTGEHWREFDEIYGRIREESSALFGTFPWIITEFSSSSIGGDKAKWIDSMFLNLHKYPEIKAAVWFSAADYDPEGLQDGLAAVLAGRDGRGSGGLQARAEQHGKSRGDPISAYATKRPARFPRGAHSHAIIDFLQHAGEAAVNLDVGAVDIVGRLGGQEHDGAHQVVQVAPAAGGDPARDVVVKRLVGADGDVHLRLDEAGADGIALDVVLAELVGEVPRDADDAVLGRHVGRALPVGGVGEHGADVDDLAAALPRHDLADLVPQMVDRFQLELQDAVIRLLGVFQERGEMVHAGVVHQDVDAAVFLQAAFHDGLQVRPVGEIAPDEGDLAAFGLDQAPDIRDILREVGDIEICARLGKRDGVAHAEALVSACDDGDLALQAEIVHAEGGDFIIRAHLSYLP